jgi:hypothetical protein
MIAGPPPQLGRVEVKEAARPLSRAASLAGL